jgi:hypothetical protein
VWVGTPLANSPCVVFGCSYFQLAFPFPWSPNLGQDVLKKFSRSQNCFLSVIWLVFFPSAALCGRFRYDSSCGWVLLLPTHLALHLGDPITNLPCPLSPNLGQDILKNLSRSQNCFLSDIWLVFLPSAPLCGHFCYNSSSVWAPLLPACVALRLGALLSSLPYIVFGRPSFQIAFPFPWSPNLGQAILKKLSRSQNCFLSVIQLVFLPSAPLCGRFCYDSSCGWESFLPNRLAFRLGTLPHFCYDSSCGCPSFQIALPFLALGRRNLYEATIRLCCEGKERVGMQDEKVPVWVKAIAKDVVLQI